jgi:hypothetical protein
MGVVALVVGMAAPAFGDDTPPSTTEPSTTEPTTAPTPGDIAAPDPTAPDATAPDPAIPDPTAPDPTAPDLVAPDPPAGAADAAVALVDPSLTVTPSTGLVHLQTVTLSGTGFTPNVSVGWAECKNNNSGDAGDCDTSHTGFASTDGSGAFSAPFTARRTLHTPNGDVDCAAAPGTCNIGAAKISDYAEHAGAPLTFDPNAPLPPPATLLAGPTSGLVEGDSVALFGGGFVPNSPVAIVQCSQPTTASCQLIASAPTDGNGSFIALVQVHRVVATPPFGATDCADAAGTCQLRVVSLSDYDREAHVLLEFDPNGPLPAGHVTVSPDTGLLNFQTVDITGAGFPANSGVQIVACKSGATSYEDCSNGNGFFVPVGPTGAFESLYRVRRILHLEDGDFDCASSPGACSLVSTAYGSLPVVVATPISFDSSVPPPPEPTITVTPSTGLVQGQSVTVTGANFAPTTFVGLSECANATEPAGYCLFVNGSTLSDANGAFTATFTVRRGVLDFATYPPGVIDCASGPQLCSITAFSVDGEDRASQAIDFDPSAPLPVPDATVTPQFGLPDRAVVNVHSSGFAPGERVLVSQCPADAPATSSCTDAFSPFNFLTADANGEIQTSLRVHRDVTTNDNGGVILLGTTSCADSVGACVIRVRSLDDPLVVADVPLGFDPTAVAPPPVLTTTPAGPFTDGQQVEVHGSGYTPGAVLGMAQCQAGVEPGGGTCDSGDDGLFTEFRADAQGTFTRTITMHTEVDGTEGPINCSGSGSCVLFAANRTDYGAERAEMPITFAAGGGRDVDVLGASRTRALAFTGAGGGTMPTAVVGLGLLLVGGALVLLARKRAVA